MRLALLPAFALLLFAAACEDADRGGLGPRGTALPPPEPGPEEAVPAPAPSTPAARPRQGRAAAAVQPAAPAVPPAQ